MDYYTPVPEILTKKYGLITAAIYGRIFRFSEEAKGCYESQGTMAEALNISISTIKVHTRLLVKDGYIKCINDGGQGRNFHFYITSKLETEVRDKEVLLSEIQTPLAEIQRTSVGDTENHIKTDYKRDKVLSTSDDHSNLLNSLDGNTDSGPRSNSQADDPSNGRSQDTEEQELESEEPLSPANDIQNPTSTKQVSGGRVSKYEQEAREHAKSLPANERYEL
ncbi:hypothetical protein LCGC14_1214040 [marine sediment metagenome]|uniref:Uncharacterized protein n=1 Tax=marine sediment metagenome TaxID=412755 RepID=A0A0F9LDA4_9ZZZZ